MLAELQRLQFAYAAVHDLATGASNGGDLAAGIDGRDQAEAILSLANECLARVASDFEARLERVMAANRGKSLCLNCAHWLPASAATPRTPPET